ncbi:alpha/beta hydrolase [Syntrophomonas erecta]
MERINIINRRGLRLAALTFWPKNECRYMIIACHGFRGAKENSGRIYRLAEKVNQLGIGLLAFDFQGSGESEGEYRSITLTRQVEDLQDVVEFVRKEYQLPILLLGRSFGGSTILAFAGQDNDIKGYIFWSTTVFLPETFAAILQTEYQRMKNGETVTLTDNSGPFELMPLLVEDFDRHDIEKYLQVVGKSKVLVIHGLDDEEVDPANARYIGEKVAGARVHLVAGADHRFINKTSEREDLTIKWLKDYF